MNVLDDLQVTALVTWAESIATSRLLRVCLDVFWYFHFL
jgi:hypothetical protein